MRPVALLLLALILAQSVPGWPVARGESWRRTCTVPLPALGPDGEGMLASLTVTVEYPGEGLVFIEAFPTSEPDTQASAVMAALAASIVAGVRMSSYNFYYKIDAPASIIGGESGGAMMALATLHLLRGRPCPSGVVATGVVLPDTSLGPVGGLKEKLLAAAGAGAEVFVVPWGELVYYEQPRGQREPIDYAYRRRLVVLPEAASEVGVEAFQAATLLDLYYISIHKATMQALPLVAPPLSQRATMAAGSAVRELILVLERLLDSSSATQEEARHLLGLAKSLEEQGSLVGAARAAYTGIRDAIMEDPSLSPPMASLTIMIGDLLDQARREARGGVNIFLLLSIASLEAARAYLEAGVPEAPARATALVAAGKALLNASRIYGVKWRCPSSDLDALTRAVQAGLALAGMRANESLARLADVASTIIQSEESPGARCGAALMGARLIAMILKPGGGPHAARSMRLMVYSMAGSVDDATLLLAREAGADSQAAGVALLAAWLQAAGTHKAPASIAEEQAEAEKTAPTRFPRWLGVAAVIVFAVGLAAGRIVTRRKGASLGVS